MSKDSEKGGFGSRLWSGGGQQREPQPDEKVVPLARPPAHHDREYVAFDLLNRAERLHIHRATQPSRFPSYNYLLDIIYDHNFESLFTLIYSFMAVEVTGQHLAPVVHAISYGNCERIHEFHRKLYDAPAQGVSVIESIKITAAGEKT